MGNANSFLLETHKRESAVGWCRQGQFPDFPVSSGMRRRCSSHKTGFIRQFIQRRPEKFSGGRALVLTYNKDGIQAREPDCGYQVNRSRTGPWNMKVVRHSICCSARASDGQRLIKVDSMIRASARPSQAPTQ